MGDPTAADPQQRIDTIRAIANADPDLIGDGDIETVVSLLGDEHERVRRVAAWALGEMGIDRVEAVHALIDCMTDDTEDRYVRERSGHALSNIIERNPEVILHDDIGETVLAVLKDDLDEVGSVSYRLWLGAARAVRTVAMEHPTTEVAQRGIDELQSLASGALDPMHSGNKHPIAAMMLATVGRQNDNVLQPVVTDLTNDLSFAETDESTRREISREFGMNTNKMAAAAANRLGWIGESAPGAVEDAIPELMSMLESENDEIAEAAARALGRIATTDPSSVATARSRLEEVAEGREHQDQERSNTRPEPAKAAAWALEKIEGQNDDRDSG